MKIKTTIIFTVKELLELNLLTKALDIKGRIDLEDSEIEFSIIEAQELGFTARQLGLC